MSKITLFILILFTSTTYSNNMRITYEKMNILPDSLLKNVPDFIKQSIQKSMHSNFELIIQNDKSIYRKIKKEEETTTDDNIKVNTTVISSGNDLDLYCFNLKTKKYIISKFLYGKQYLINDIQKIDSFILTGKSKILLNFKVVEKIKIVGNDTMRIWVSNLLPKGIGPENYSDDDGTILELELNSKIYQAKEIDKIYESHEIIEEPKFGKLISNIEFEKLEKKMNKEWKEENDIDDSQSGVKIKTITY